MKDLSVIVVYRSPANNSHAMLIQSLMSLITTTIPTIIMGDFNVDPKRDAVEYNNLVSALGKKGFVQVINKATHIKGHMLDHIYIRNIANIGWQLHHPEYAQGS